MLPSCKALFDDINLSDILLGGQAGKGHQELSPQAGLFKKKRALKVFYPGVERLIRGRGIS